MTTENPWLEIAPGKARRADATHPFEFFWLVDQSAQPSLVLEVTTAANTQPLPSARGLTVNVTSLSETKTRLALRLADRQLEDIFRALCRDLLEATRSSADEPTAMETAINRTWRWHHLLRGGRGSLLSEGEQQGLIGELYVFETLCETRGVSTAVTAWRGPLDAPKDFEIGLYAIEAKARRGAAAPHVAISSEDQLDTDGLNGLFLHVIDLSPAEEGAGITLTEVARRALDRVRSEHEGLVEPFESRLFAAGFDWDQDYSAFRWIEGTHRLYQVTEEFPRIQGSTLADGIGHVRYSLDLHSLQDFATTWAQALQHMETND